MMNMNMNTRRSAVLGIVLIVLGLVWWMNLWWLIWPGALAVFGVAAYLQRRVMGRVVEAVQGGLWGLGLSALFLFDFVWPGLLLLAGISVLLRGREYHIDTRIQALFGRFRRGGSTAMQRVPSQHVPVVTHPAAPVQHEQTYEPPTPVMGDTTRLRD